MFVQTLFVLPALVAFVVAAPTPAKRSTTGQATWYYPGLGACGYTDSSDDSVIAVSAQIYGSGSYCNQYVTITNTANGNSATGQIRDECESCGSGDLDLSPALFEELGSLDSGVLSISWSTTSDSSDSTSNNDAVVVDSSSSATSTSTSTQSEQTQNFVPHDRHRRPHPKMT